MNAPLRLTEHARNHTLAIEGMTCASCVGHVERALRTVDGVVQARVNLATETAEVEAAPSVSRAKLAQTVEPIRRGTLADPLNQHRLPHPRVKLLCLHPPPPANAGIGLYPKQFYSGATKQIGRFSEGLLLRLLHDIEADWRRAARPVRSSVGYSVIRALAAGTRGLRMSDPHILNWNSVRFGMRVTD